MTFFSINLYSCVIHFYQCKVIFKINHIKLFKRPISYCKQHISTARSIFITFYQAIPRVFWIIFFNGVRSVCKSSLLGTKSARNLSANADVMILVLKSKYER